MPGKRERITLGRRDLRRISKVVRDSERGDRDMGPSQLRTVYSDDGGTEIKRGTFSAPWNKGSTKTVTDATTSGVTYANVQNYFASVTGTGTKACAIAYVGTEWILIAAEC
jgi:hypothetical protein